MSLRLLSSDVQLCGCCLSFDWPFLRTFWWHNRRSYRLRNKCLVICFLLSQPLRLMGTMAPGMGGEAAAEDRSVSMVPSISRIKGSVHFCGQPLCSVLSSAFLVLIENMSFLFQFPLLQFSHPEASSLLTNTTEQHAPWLLLWEQFFLIHSWWFGKQWGVVGRTVFAAALTRASPNSASITVRLWAGNWPFWTSVSLSLKLRDALQVFFFFKFKIMYAKFLVLCLLQNKLSILYYALLKYDFHALWNFAWARAQEELRSATK